MKKLIILLCMMFLLVGCGNDGSANSDNGNNAGNEEGADNKDDSNSNNDAESNEDDFVFEYNSVPIRVDDKADEILDKLGDPNEYFEAPSCAYQGMDKTYYYPGFELTTYTLDDVDYVANVVLVDDTVSTKEGVYIGSEVSEVVQAYGDDYKEEVGQYVYGDDDSKLQFIVDDDHVKSITYLKPEE